MESITKLRVLLLEDSPLDAELITDWLNSDGLDCAVRWVQTRDDFSLALHEGGFDVILSDYSLPGFDGITALDLARQMRPGLPFLFVSGHLGEELAIETLKRGATDYVLKGRLERLLPSVRRALREAREREERQRIEATLHVLSQASLVLSSLDYSTTLSHVARLAVPHFADYCIVDVAAPEGAIERVAVAHAEPEKEPLAQRLLGYGPTPASHHPIWKVLESQQPQLIPQVPDSLIGSVTRDEEHAALLRELGFSSCMLVPLLAEGRALGVMSFMSASPSRSYNALDLSLAEDLARRCAMAVENARLHLKTLDALRARDEFLAVLSHELRSPLGAILGWSTLLQQDGADEATFKHGLQVIERNTRTQVQLINELLEVSRIITGRLRLDMAPVVLEDVVSNVILSMAPTAAAKGVEIRFSPRATHGAPQGRVLEAVEVLGDVDRLQQIVWNLLSNAVKFTPSGGRVEVSVEGGAGQASVTVSDSGEGIAPEFLPYVFDRFRQADSSSTRRHGGLGLGLAIVRHLAEMHGGSVHAHSAGVEQGATFSLRLPLRASAPPLAEEAELQALEARQESSEAPDSTALSGLRILLVEDGDDARELLAAILRRAGAQVTLANSAQVAMDELARSPRSVPDVLVSDIGMPGEDGYSLIRRVRAWEAGQGLSEPGRRIPAAALTAYASQQDAARALEAGFQIHLAKPMEPASLVAAIAGLARGVSCSDV